MRCCEILTRPVRAAAAAAFLATCLAWPGLAAAQTEGQGEGMDESGAIDDFVDKAAAESNEARLAGVKVPVGQKPLMSEQEWKKTTRRIFGVTLAGEYSYWIEGKFGLGSNASYHEQVFTLNIGAECEICFRLKDWIRAVVRGDFMYHQGSKGVINGLNAEISSFNTTALMLGAKIHTPLMDVFSIKEGSILEDIDFYVKAAFGPIYMPRVLRRQPAPSQTYWNPGLLWGVNLCVGLELKMDERFSFFFEHTFDLFSAPHASSALRPGNKAGPFYFYVVQVGWTFYFD